MTFFDATSMELLFSIILDICTLLKTAQHQISPIVLVNGYTKFYREWKYDDLKVA